MKSSSNVITDMIPQTCVAQQQSIAMAGYWPQALHLVCQASALRLGTPALPELPITCLQLPFTQSSYGSNFSC